MFFIHQYVCDPQDKKYKCHSKSLQVDIGVSSGAVSPLDLSRFTVLMMFSKWVAINSARYVSVIQRISYLRHADICVFVRAVRRVLKSRQINVRFAGFSSYRLSGINDRLSLL